MQPDAYSESCYISENLQIIRTRTYLKLDKYSEPSQRFKIELFAKIAESYNCFSKALHLRSLIRLSIRLSPNKYSSKLVE